MFTFAEVVTISYFIEAMPATRPKISANAPPDAWLDVVVVDVAGGVLAGNVVDGVFSGKVVEGVLT
jgi:hypothetical protein